MYSDTNIKHVGMCPNLFQYILYSQSWRNHINPSAIHRTCSRCIKNTLNGKGISTMDCVHANPWQFPPTDHFHLSIYLSTIKQWPKVNTCQTLNDFFSHSNIISFLLLIFTCFLRYFQGLWFCTVRLASTRIDPMFLSKLCFSLFSKTSRNYDTIHLFDVNEVRNAHKNFT
jgi:hypothetical protein